MLGIRLLSQVVSPKKAVLNEQGEQSLHNVLILQQNLEFYLNEEEKYNGECCMLLVPGSTID